MRMAQPEVPPPEGNEWWAQENLDPRHFYAAYSFDKAESRHDDIVTLVAEARRLGYPVRYWWLSDAMELSDDPDRLIVCVHHPSSAEDAGMDLYEALKEKGMASDDLEKAAVEEYLRYSKTIQGTDGVLKPDGVALFPPGTPEAAETQFLVYYTLGGLMLVNATDAKAASDNAFASLHAFIGKSERQGVTVTEASDLHLGDLEIAIDSTEALEFPSDEDAEAPTMSITPESE
jgi:hypothetical protein